MLAVALAAVLAQSADVAHCEMARPFEQRRGWNEIVGWMLPNTDGRDYGASYICSGTKRKIVVMQLMDRTPQGLPVWRYISELTLPKFERGEDILEGGMCTRDGKDDEFLVPFGTLSKDGQPHLRHVWRIELPSGKILPVNVSRVKCEALLEQD
jgi:hypothetical protein